MQSLDIFLLVCCRLGLLQFAWVLHLDLAPTPHVEAYTKLSLCLSMCNIAPSTKATNKCHTSNFRTWRH